MSCVRNKVLYTIGHTNHNQDEFLELLKDKGINYLLDVRSTPYSKYTSQFNKEEIEKFLQNKGISYTHMGKYFGARPTDLNLYTQQGYLDFEKVRESDNFQKGLESVIRGINVGNTIALMCTEKDPFDCHRAIMVSRGFELNGIEVKHILPNGDIQTQDELNRRLLNKFYPNRNQGSLFEELKSDEELLLEAYRKRNEDIGYRINNNEEEYDEYLYDGIR